MSDTVLERGRKLAEEMKLRKMHCGCGGFYPDDIHRILGEGDEMLSDQRNGGWQYTAHDLNPKFKALLIAIRPIVQESPERALLRDLIANEEFCGPRNEALVKRARALLAGGWT